MRGKILSITISMLISIAVQSLALSQTGSQNNQTSDDTVSDESWQKLSIPNKQVYVQREMSLLNDLVRDEVISHLKNQAVAMPFQGIGIVIGPPTETGVKINAVYKNSPADKAGVKPGDSLESVDNEALLLTDQESRGKKATDLIGNLLSPVSLKFKRGQETYKVNLSKEKIGEELGTFYRANVDRWIALLQEGQTTLSDIEKRYAANPDNEKNLDSCWTALMETLKKVLIPLREYLHERVQWIVY